MPIITCPKCQGKLRFPDDSPARRVKCPSCGQVFMSSDGMDASAPSASSSTRPDLPRARDSRGDFELPDEDDRPRSRRVADDEDDDRGRRSRSRRRYEEEEDEGPRSGRRRYDPEDDRRSRSRDDEDDRPRRRRSRDDNYDRVPPRRREDSRAIDGQFNRASLACLLLFIAGWLQVGGIAVVTFLVLLDWLGVREGLTLFAVLAGLLGVGSWLTSATGLGFLVSGPRKRGALGLSIATAGTAGLHLMLLIVIATSKYYGGFGATGPARSSEIHWDAFVTQARALPMLLFFAIGFDQFFRNVTDGSIVPVFANLTEVARGVLLLLTFRAIMVCARDERGASLSTKAMVGYAIGAGALILLGVLFGLLMIAVRPARPTREGFEGMSAVFHLFLIVLHLGLAGMAVTVTLVTKAVKGRIDYRR